MSGLDAVIPVAVDVAAAGRTYAVLPLTIGQYPAFCRAIGGLPLADVLAAADALGPEQWLRLIGEHGEAIVAAVGIATSASADELNAMAPDDFLALALGVVEANLDFFARRLGPRLEAVAARIQAVLPGPTSSSG